MDSLFKDEIFKALKKIAKKISKEIKYADFGYTDSKNKTGDNQLKLDVKSDEIITEILSEIPNVKALASEEKDEMLFVDKNAKFIISYDPLDGSSLVDVNFSIGSIFGIYENEISSKTLVASAYIIYGPRLEMVFCDKKPELYRRLKDKEFHLIKELTLNEQGKLNATGGTQKYWGNKHKKLINHLFDSGYRLRYSGAMVSDLHQILLKGGGLFSYPSTKDAPNGKLRASFEVLPFAYIYEKAGGKTTDGKLNSLFDIKINGIHQTTPCFFGSNYEISKVLEIYNEKD